MFAILCSAYTIIINHNKLTKPGYIAAIAKYNIMNIDMGVW